MNDHPVTRIHSRMLAPNAPYHKTPNGYLTKTIASNFKPMTSPNKTITHENLKLTSFKTFFTI